MVKILYIDDDTVSAMLTAYELEQHGHTVLVAKSGLQGLALLRKDIRFICCDYGMPEMNGAEFVALLRTDRRYARYASTPVIGVGDFPHEKRDGLSACFAKPFSWEDLAEYIRTYAPKL